MQYRDVFDFMAVAIRTIIDNVDNEFYNIIDSKSLKKVLRIEAEMKRYIPELFSYSKFYEALLEGDFLQRLWQYYNIVLNKKDFDSLLTVLEKLDTLLKEQIEIYGMLNESQEDAELYTLNNNVNECNLQLLPKFSCTWRHNNREKTTSKSVNTSLRYCYYIPMEELQGYSVKHIFLTNRFENAEERGFLNIAMTPLCNQAELMLDFYEKDETYRFSIEGISKVEEITECVLNQLELAKKHDVDILLYPEMLGCDEIINAVKEQLEEFCEDEKDYPDLIVCPTVWHDNKNVCNVLDRFGMTIIKQEKQHPFPLVKNDVAFIEGIESDKTIHLIHCQGIGRIVVLICKDALQREYLHMILEHLKATLVIIPSFSTGNYDFKELMQMCRTYDCCSIWVNTCSVGMLEGVNPEKLDVKGFLLRTGKHDNGLENKFYEFTDCVQKKGLECKECIYIERLLF